MVDVIFLCEYESGNLEIKEPDEVEKIHLLTTEEVLNNPRAHDYLKHYIQLAATTFQLNPTL